MPRASRIDHLVIAALTLEEGVDYIRQRLGLEIPAGGKHAAMATHNHLMQLGDELFLEVIATDPMTEQNPDRLQQPRWYGLDDPLLRQSLVSSPRLVSWVVNTDDLQAVGRSSDWSVGRNVAIQRGNLQWLFGLPSDGRLPASGMLPYLIQWQTERHPACNMVDTGARLRKLEVFHPYPEWLCERLRGINADHLVTVIDAGSDGEPYLCASIEVDCSKQNKYFVNSALYRQQNSNNNLEYNPENRLVIELKSRVSE